jgi:hypothetical protein
MATKPEQIRTQPPAPPLRHHTGAGGWDCEVEMAIPRFTTICPDAWLRREARRFRQQLVVAMVTREARGEGVPVDMLKLVQHLKVEEIARRGAL